MLCSRRPHIVKKFPLCVLLCILLCILYISFMYPLCILYVFRRWVGEVLPAATPHVEEGPAVDDEPHGDLAGEEDRLLLLI